MRKIGLLLAAALLVGMIPVASANTARDDGFVAKIGFEKGVTTPASTIVPAPPGSTIVVLVQLFEGDWRNFHPFVGTATLAFHPLERSEATGLPHFDTMDDTRIKFATDTNGKAHVAVNSDRLRDLEHAGPGNAFLVSVTTCEDGKCATSFHSWTNNVLISNGNTPLADFAEYEEPNSDVRPTTTPVEIVEA